MWAFQKLGGAAREVPLAWRNLVADKPRLTKIVHEFVHLDPQPRQGIEQQELTVGWKDVTGVNSHANAAAT